MPAINNAPTDTEAVVANTTIGMLGGIIIPKEADDALMAEASSPPYPASFMGSIIIPPIAAAVAGAEPEIAPKKVADMVVMQAEAAGSFLKHILIKRTSRSEMPLTSISSPDRVKRGSARRGKLSSEVNIFCVIAGSAFISPAVSMLSMVAKPTATAIGVPKIRKNTRLKIKTRPNDIAIYRLP